jgi:tyrosine-protein phosphatase SIW14
VSSSSFKVESAVLILALAVGGPVIGSAADGQTSAANVAVHPAIRLDIDNFGRINDSYYRGAAPDKDQFAALMAFGIKTIIDLRSGDGDPADKLRVERAGMKYAHLPMTTHEPPTAEMVHTFLNLVTDRANQPVYVHCVGGRHRTGVMTAVYRMTREGWTADQAFQEMKRYKFGADFLHPEFKRFVYGFHGTFASTRPSQ